MRAKKLLFFLTTIFWYGFLVLVSMFRVAFSHTYQHWLPSGTEMPFPTKLLALPLMGMQHSGIGDTLLFYTYWIILWVIPGILLSLAMRQTEPLKAMEIWIYGWSVYFVFALLSLFLIASALWLPFSLL